MNNINEQETAQNYNSHWMDKANIIPSPDHKYKYIYILYTIIF